MSWGIKITILYVGFVLLISSMVIISSSHKVELVAKDYYAQELDYQQRIDALKNERDLKVSILHSVLKDAIELSYPMTEETKHLDGDILFFRPSDSDKDLKIKLNFDSNGKQVIPKTLLIKGIYKMCLTWKNNGHTYYKEEVIKI